jgi:uncharacterized protein YbaA (DUF1428 family)
MLREAGRHPVKETAVAYINGAVIPAKTAGKEKYRENAKMMAALFREYGATATMDAWGADVPDGKVTDFKRAVNLAPDETVVFSWMVWPDKATADAAWEKIQSDPRMAASNPPIDGKRMIWAGFESLY